jgi:hypothetical protein
MTPVPTMETTMTIHALTAGVLWKSPESRTSKTGKQFTSATLRVKDGDDMQFVKVLAFGTDQRDELAPQ